MRVPSDEVLAAWPTPNYIDPVTRGNGNVVMNCVLYSLLFTIVCLRIFVRTHLRKIFGLDDMFILVAMVPTTAFFILSVLANTKFLWIRHQYDIPADRVVTGLKMVLTTQVVFAAACTLTKLSMLMLVRRMLSSATLFWRRITQLAILIVSLQGSIFVITVIFQCRPPQDYWKITIEAQPNCINQESSLLLAGIINTFTDFLVVLLPIRTVWSLQLPFRQTAFIIFLFGAGFVSCIAGCVRTYFTYRVTRENDQVWAAYPVWVSAGIELYVGIICASIPATKPFFSTYLPALFGTITTTLRSTTHSGHFPQFRNSRGIVRQNNAAGNGLTSFSFHHAHPSQQSDVELEKGLDFPRKGSADMSMASSSRKGMGDEDDWGVESNCIRITQTVDLVSTRCSVNR